MGLIKDVGGLYGNVREQTPYKSYKFYVDFTGLLVHFTEYCVANHILRGNSSMDVNKGFDNTKTEDVAIRNSNELLEHVTFYNLANDNSLRSALDFGFYVNNINLPKYTMKNVKSNYMDRVIYNPIKTSYGGELNLSMKSTFHNITKISLLLGFFEAFDTYNIWDHVYSFVGKKKVNVMGNKYVNKTSEDRDNGRGMDVISDRKYESGSPNIDIVLVDDTLEDSMAYRLVNPIITGLDFGSFAYGTNAINEMKMTISYNSWYVVDGEVRPRSNTKTYEDSWDIKATNKLKSELDSAFNSLGKTFKGWQEKANDVGESLPWGKDRSDKLDDGKSGYLF